ncbi:MAG: SLC13 family permease [Lachnospiraceae bacterium]|nr:SLC13 family permease [Lachnospiraceae bacterium]
MIIKILALSIFLLMFILIITEVWERHIVTLGCGLLTLVLVFGIGMHSFDAISETLNLQSLFTGNFWIAAAESGETSSGINWATIIFIAGMMIMVEGMAEAGFFRWLCLKIAKLVKYKTQKIFLTFMILSAFLSMFIDSITVILFLAAVTIELAELLHFKPVPMILAEVFCANLGGSATMCGDPPNIIIGTSLGYSFADFLQNTGLIALVSLVLIIVYFTLTLGKTLGGGDTELEQACASLKPTDAIQSKRKFVASTVIFFSAVILLVTHAYTGLTVAFIGVTIGAATLLSAGDAFALLRKLDYKTLLFFIGLFIVVGGLEQTKLLELLAGFIGKASGDNTFIMVCIILWLSAIASAFIDNIPFAATMVPVISSLAATTGVPLSILVWALAMGTDIGGSATPIGASANVVGIATASKHGYVVKWGEYCKTMVPATILVMLVTMAMIYVRYL